LDGFHPLARLYPETPWGRPSSPITISATPNGTPIAFIARHGSSHEYNPTEVNSRANIAALKHLGVKAIVAFSAVGSLREEIRPRDVVVPDQIIDRTRGLRNGTFFEGGIVGHAMFADPFDAQLISIVGRCESALQGDDIKMHLPPGQGGEKKFLTLGCMEGPPFSTRAESHLYRSWGGDIINMSAIPEAKLAREVGIAYCMVCMATDYDCWREGEEEVSVERVMGHVKANTSNAIRLTRTLLVEIEKELTHHALAKNLEGTMKFACVTPAGARDPKALERLEYVLPGYY